MAIARIWRGTTLRSARDGYLTYLERTGFADYGSTEGSLGVLGLRRDVGERTEFLLVSLWDSMDAVRHFAGSDPGRAVFYPEDERFLVDADREVDHWEVCFLSPHPGSEQGGSLDPVLGVARGGAIAPAAARIARIASSVGRWLAERGSRDEVEDPHERGWRIVRLR